MGLPADLEVKGTYGDPDLICQIAELYGCPREGVVPVPGASSANFIALSTLLESGAAVMLEHPTYDPFSRVASFLGFRIIPIQRPPTEGFDVRVDYIEAGLRHGPRAVVLTNLHNPSGRLLSQEKIRQIAQVCARVNATLIVDEVYLDAVHLTRRRGRWTSAVVAPNVIATCSLTKVYGLGGLRCGWLVAAPSVADQARAVMDLLSVDNAAPATALALHAFSELGPLEARYRRFYDEGQPLFRRWLAQEPLLRGYSSFGALFECIRLPDGITGESLNDHLVSQYDTQVVPGGFFGLSDHIRLSIALPAPDLAEALSRISEATRDLLEHPPP